MNSTKESEPYSRMIAYDDKATSNKICELVNTKQESQNRIEPHSTTRRGWADKNIKRSMKWLGRKRETRMFRLI